VKFLQKKKAKTQKRIKASTCMVPNNLIVCVVDLEVIDLKCEIKSLPHPVMDETREELVRCHNRPSRQPMLSFFREQAGELLVIVLSL
jgi:hypothetical protein